MKRDVSIPEKLFIVNIGLKVFFDELKKQRVPVVHVDWKPPKAEQEQLKQLLDKIL